MRKSDPAEGFNHGPAREKSEQRMMNKLEALNEKLAITSKIMNVDGIYLVALTRFSLQTW